MELNDNRISLYVAQRGKCAVCKEPLQLWDMEVHHLTSRAEGGKDDYSNLVFVTKDVHKLIHATNPETIQGYLRLVDLAKIILARWAKNSPGMNSLKNRQIAPDKSSATSV